MSSYIRELILGPTSKDDGPLLWKMCLDSPMGGKKRMGIAALWGMFMVMANMIDWMFFTEAPDTPPTSTEVQETPPTSSEVQERPPTSTEVRERPPTSSDDRVPEFLEGLPKSMRILAYMQKFETDFLLFAAVELRCPYLAYPWMIAQLVKTILQWKLLLTLFYQRKWRKGFRQWNRSASAATNFSHGYCFAMKRLPYSKS